MSSRTWSIGSPPWTSTRRRAEPAENSSDRSGAVGVVMRPFGRVPVAVGGALVGPAPGHVLADLVEVPPEGLDHRVGVAPLQRRHDGGVELGRPFRVGARDDERQVGPRERLERPPGLLEGQVVRELHDPAVEPGVGLGDAATVVVAGRGAHRLEVGAQPGEVVRR